MLVALALASMLQAKPDFAFTKVNVVPMDRERVIYGQTVLIKDGRILQIGEFEDIRVPADTPKVDGNGEMFLLPGLSDMHMHLYYTGDLLSLLANGVTTTRNMRGKPLHLQWRKEVAEGKLLGPRVIASGPTLGGTPDGQQENFVTITTPEQGPKEVKDQFKAGYDSIKVYDGLPAPALKSIIKAAHDRGMRVAGHSNNELKLMGTLRSGIDCLEHAEQFAYDHFGNDYDVAKIEAVVKQTKASKVYICPTMGLIDNYIQLRENKALLLERPEIRFANPEVVAWWKSLERKSAGSNKLIYWFQAKLVKQMADAGVPLLAGTDTHIVGYVPGFSLHREFEHMAMAGLTPYQILQSTTSTAGQYLRLDIGQLKVGYEADLLLVRGNPLASHKELQNRVGVMARGRWYTQEFLDGKLEEMVADYKSEAP